MYIYVYTYVLDLRDQPRARALLAQQLLVLGRISMCLFLKLIVRLKV